MQMVLLKCIFPQNIFTEAHEILLYVLQKIDHLKPYYKEHLI